MTLNGCTALGGRDFDLKVAISPKWCEIGPRLQLITNRKSYTGFDWHRKQRPWITLSTRIEVLRILHLFAVGLHTCTAVARSLCVSWAFLFELSYTLRVGFLAKILGNRACKSTWIAPTAVWPVLSKERPQLSAQKVYRQTICWIIRLCRKLLWQLWPNFWRFGSQSD